MKCSYRPDKTAKGRPQKLSAMAIAVLLLATLVSGCSTQPAKTNVAANNPNNNPAAVTDGTSTGPAAPAAPTTPNAAAMTLTIYFPGPDASGLVAVKREVTVTDKEVIKAMFKELNNPPSGLDKPLPTGTKLLAASVKDGVATLDLSQEFQKNFSGGSAGEQMILFSIVNTLTTLPNVHSVQFLLEGKTEAAILGHEDTTTPIKRNESLILKS